MKSAVQKFIEEIENYNGVTRKGADYVIKKALEMEELQAHQYAEFAIRCDRKDMKILNFKEWIKL